MALKYLEEIEREAKPGNVAITMGFVGQVAPNFGIDNEVTNRRLPGTQTGRAGKPPWTPIDGSEQVILGDLSILTQGATVRVAPSTGEAEVVRADAHPNTGGGRSHAGGR